MGRFRQRIALQLVDGLQRNGSGIRQAQDPGGPKTERPVKATRLTRLRNSLKKRFANLGKRRSVS